MMSLEWWKNGFVGPLNNDGFKLNFDGSTKQNISSLGRVIIDSNGIIKMTTCRHIDNSSIIVANE